MSHNQKFSGIAVVPTAFVGVPPTNPVASLPTAKNTAPEGLQPSVIP
jgi:hypothetical protein